ncbi:Membrane protein NosY [Cupriavidus taiwanensis]|uniref:Membrane protein NosY n=2 Tax=Cupriavidus taiwanensis TaxID=164546 RepID=A0A375DWH2_9BURK|nr:ABC transporter permease subunit [Cupriavidus taiwanensis]SOZ49547.1 Membrane protein NosY [Cupriavidus taiwanensis]SOZ50047.1 Membrane protein NosY [Cupriavidus taiwanensis]SOZ53135.1 Membrane protein NosY [Cupriavidus taiwanensis]SPA07301.1 Membrane protein NosY [Cupriavidus taiwanensis]
MSMGEWFDARQVAALAGREFRERMRNRWVLAVAAVFTALSLAIGYFGGAEQGVLGPRSLEFVITSLASLVIYLVPMIALLLGFDAVVGERERGSLDLLLSLPLTRGELLLGKYLGLAAALVLATAGGFALMVLLLVRQFGWPGLYHTLGFVASAVLLGLAFLSLALWLSVLSRDRAQASGLAIGLWFFFVLVFDLLLLGMLVAGSGADAQHAATDWIAWLLLLNPADLFRIVNAFSLDQLRSAGGVASIVPPALASPWPTGAALLAWIAVPLGLAARSFR